MVKAPIGNKVTALLAALEFTKVISELESITGLVWAFIATAVKPDAAAVFNPFAIVSRSSKPGSPKHTLLSNQPCEI